MATRVTPPSGSGLPKKIPAVLLVLLLAAAGPAVRGRQRNADALDGLLRLYQARDYFALRDAVEGMENDPSPDMAFFRGTVANAFNRLDAAVTDLRRYLQAGPSEAPRPLAKHAWIILADAYRRAGLYRKAGEAYRLILARFSEDLDASEKANYQNQASLWSALAAVPPQSVEVPGDSVIQMEKRNFPVRIKDRIVYFWYDTGSSLSVLYESEAEKLGLKMIDPGTKIQSATGKWIENRLAVVPALSLGEAVVRNAVFLVLPDELFPVRKVRPGVERRGLIGAPILTALKEIIETKDGRLLIPSLPSLPSPRNMCFFGFQPIIEAFHRGERIFLCADTGSSATFLYPPFFRRHRAVIKARSKLREVTMGGVGDSRSVAVHVLHEFDFRVAGRDISLRKIMVHTEESHTDSAVFDGILGLDVLSQCSRMIFNFESMSFVLE